MSERNLISASAATFLGLPRLPGSLDGDQAAAVLGIPADHIPVLVRGGLLKPLGDPPKNGIKRFAASDIIDHANDRDWLHKAHKYVNRFWKLRNTKTNAQRQSHPFPADADMAT